MSQRFSLRHAALLSLFVFNSMQTQQAPPPPNQPPKEPMTLDVQGGKIRAVPIATGLFHPWSLAFTDAHTILVTERNAHLLRFSTK